MFDSAAVGGPLDSLCDDLFSALDQPECMIRETLVHHFLLMVDCSFISVKGKMPTVEAVIKRLLLDTQT